MLPNEEQVYSAVYHDNIDRFDCRTFNTWYYPDPKNPIYDTFLPHLANRIPKPFFEIFL